MKRTLLMLLLFSMLIPVSSENRQISSPDGNLLVNIQLNNGTVSYSLIYKKKRVLEESPLGLITNVSDFSRHLVLVEDRKSVV